MKHEWKKHEKELYNIKKSPSIITVPEQKFIMVSGKGNQSDSDFSEKVKILHSLAYHIKIWYKAYCNNNISQNKEFAYDDYTVFPLEGIWAPSVNNPLDKNAFEYTIMIRQPDFITQEIFEACCTIVAKKKFNRFLKEVAFSTVEDGLCIQILHVGTFDNEPASFKKMDEFAKQNRLERIEKYHREIYINNAKLASKFKCKLQKTILRYRVKQSSLNVTNCGMHVIKSANKENSNGFLL